MRLKPIHTVELSQNKLIVDECEVFSASTETSPAEFFKLLYGSLNLNYLKFFKMDLLSKLGFLSAEALLQKVNLTEQQKETLGMLIFNTTSSLETDVNFQQTIQNDNEFFPSPSIFVYTLPNIVIGEIAIRHKLFGENRLMIVENFCLDKIMEEASTIIEANNLKHCIVGYLDFYQDNFKSHFIYLSE